jgi:hypothetical protein
LEFTKIRLDSGLPRNKNPCHIKVVVFRLWWVRYCFDSSAVVSGAANVARGARRAEIPAAIRGQLGDRALCHPLEQSTFILNLY